MVDIKNYIVDGVVKRDKIVADIKKGKLSKNDIYELSKDEKIRASYFGKNILKKCDKKDWNKKYLDELSLASVSEVFNGEYLLLLNEVAEYVNAVEEKKERSVKILKMCVCALGIILTIVLGIKLLS